MYLLHLLMIALPSGNDIVSLYVAFSQGVYTYIKKKISKYSSFYIRKKELYISLTSSLPGIPQVQVIKSRELSAFFPGRAQNPYK